MISLKAYMIMTGAVFGELEQHFCLQQAIGLEWLSTSLIGHKYPVIVVVIAGVRLCYDCYVRLKQSKRLFFWRFVNHIVFTTGIVFYVFYSKNF